MKQQYINSMLFAHLFEIGGQSLVGTYAMLLYGRNGFHCYLPYKNSNGKLTIGKRLISKQSGVSLTALNTHLKTIIKLGLGEHMKCGGFKMAGRQATINKYHKRKFVPIRIGKNLRETKGNVNAVIITSNIWNQVKQIDKKITLNKILCLEKKGSFLTSAQRAILENAHKNKSINLDGLNKVENTVLSNKGISNLIRGVESSKNKNSLSHGGYWRKVLQDRGFIYSRRRYRTIWGQKISYKEFLSMKKWFNEQHGFVTYKNGRVVKPIVSEIMLPNLDIIDSNIYNTKYILDKYNKSIEVEIPFLDIVNPTQNRLSKKESKKRISTDGSFDFIDWLELNPEININNYKEFAK